MGPLNKQRGWERGPGLEEVFPESSPAHSHVTGLEAPQGQGLCDTSGHVVGVHWSLAE